MVHGLLVICLLASLAAAETPAPAAEEISGMIQAEIMSMPEWNGADVRVEIKGEVKRAPDESFRVVPGGLKNTINNVLVQIEMVRDGKVTRSLWIPAVIHISVTAITASRKIASGEMITERDVRENRVETTNIAAALARNPKEIAGKIAKRSFAAGEPLPLGAFSDLESSIAGRAPLVRRGDMVNMRLERGGIVLTSNARALENGRFGEIIRVKSMDFSSEVSAQVTGQAEVSIQ